MTDHILTAESATFTKNAMAHGVTLTASSRVVTKDLHHFRSLLAEEGQKAGKELARYAIDVFEEASRVEVSEVKEWTAEGRIKKWTKTETIVNKYNLKTLID